MLGNVGVGVGVSEVTQSVQPASLAPVPTDTGDRPAMDVVRHGDTYRARADDPELSEYFVRVKWPDTVDANRAFNEVGLFGNQNTVCQPTTPKWRHTVERLKTVFPRSTG
jgi:hypothetical protein